MRSKYSCSTRDITRCYGIFFLDDADNARISSWLSTVTVHKTKKEENEATNKKKDKKKKCLYCRVLLADIIETICLSEGPTAAGAPASSWRPSRHGRTYNNNCDLHSRFAASASSQLCFWPDAASSRWRGGRARELTSLVLALDYVAPA